MGSDDKRSDHPDGALVSRFMTPDADEPQGAEDAGLHSNAEWETIFDSLSDMVTIHDAQFNIIKANRSARRLLKLPPSGSLTGTKCFACYHGTEKPPAGCPSGRCAETLEESVSEVFEPHLNRHLEVRAIPRLDAHRRYIGVLHVVRDITERKRTDAATWESERRFRRFIETALEGFCELDTDWRIRTVNSQFEKMFGYASGEAIGLQIVEDLLFPDDRAPMIERLRRRKGGEAEAYEQRFRRKDGESLWAIVSASPVKDADGNVLGAFAMMADITERRRAEETLRDSEEQFHLAVNATNDGMWDINLCDGTVRFNQSYIATFGTPSENEDAWLWWTDHVHPDDRDRTLSSFNDAVNGSVNVWRCEYRFRRLDGTWAYAYDHAHIRRDSRGKADYVTGALADITDSKLATEALERSEQHVRLLLDSISEGFYGVDTQGHCILVNRACLRMLGYDTEEELLGRHIHETIHHTRPDGTPYPKEECRMYEALRSGSTVANVADEVFWRRDGTSFPVECSSFPILRNGQLMGAVASFFDVTERKRAEQAQARLQAQLQQAQKMESVGRLAGGVAHDFNNMLGVILGHVELALDQVDPTQPLHADLQQVHDAAVRSADLTRQLLAFARKQTILPKVLNLGEVVASMLKMLQRLIGEDIDLRWQPGADLWRVNMDPAQIDQILANLCVNARDAISGVGRITIETGNSTLDGDYCETHAWCVPGEYARLAVSDDGCGMDSETANHIFEPFFTTKGAGEGTGLGLATVYGIVKQNHGFINVYSEPGHGATFTIYLPRYVGAAGPTDTKKPEGSLVRGHETILLVEDEPSILSLTKRLLERQGYTVMSASTPGEAIRQAEEHFGEIHLLMTDVVMPEMNGRVLASKLRSIHPHVKRLFMSGYTANVIAHQGVLDEGVHFIQKPFSAEDLSAKVREAIDAPD
jgi:PAS domain S-box-containing protein